jgi:carnitine O-acetyltransferase
MRQYQFLFNATRLPRLPSDHVAIYDPRLNGHVAVVCRDNYYIVECFDSQRRLSVQELHGQLQWIAQHSQHQQQVPENQRISYLTAAHRDRWTAAYDSLRSESPLNSRSLDRLQSAAFLICLDDGQPQNIEQLSRACWHGDGSSRWFDKSFQLICFANGKAGCLGEHSMFDATVPARMCDYILDRCFQECPPSVQSSLDDKRVGVPVEWLQFDLNAEISQSIQEAKSNLDKAIGAHDLRVLQYAGYGKELIKQFQVSPDSFVQMAIQLAYFKMMGTWVATYETAGMRRYNWGRTETCRSVSIDSVAFIKAMEDQSIAVFSINYLIFL